MTSLTLSEYQSRCVRTAKKHETLDMALCNWSMGFSGEANEGMEHIKKVVFHGHKLDTVLMAKEIGDALWYASLLCEELGLDLGEVAVQNINKLSHRYPNGFNSKDSIERSPE